MSVPLVTCSRRRSPLEMCATWKWSAMRVAWVPLPAPGAPISRSRTALSVGGGAKWLRRAIGPQDQQEKTQAPPRPAGRPDCHDPARGDTEQGRAHLYPARTGLVGAGRGAFPATGDEILDGDASVGVRGGLRRHDGVLRA